MILMILLASCGGIDGYQHDDCVQYCWCCPLCWMLVGQLTIIQMELRSVLGNRPGHICSSRAGLVSLVVQSIKKKLVGLHCSKSVAL